MKKIIHKTGAIEFVSDKKEQEFKDKYKDKKPADLTDKQVKELVYKLAKRANLI